MTKCLPIAFRAKIMILRDKQSPFILIQHCKGQIKKSVTMSRDHTNIKDKKEKTYWVDGSSMIMVKGKGKEDEASLRTNDLVALKSPIFFNFIKV